MSIPFVRNMEFKYGAVTVQTPLVRRIIARNPGPFTFHGTGTYIIGHRQVAIIDPGPKDDAHIAALLNAVRGANVTHIFVTHTHRDHSAAAGEISKATGAKTYGFSAHTTAYPITQVEEGVDCDFKPDHLLIDGDTEYGPDWSIVAVHTPGHTSNHLCFALKEELTLFSGDHVMGWSTTVVSPPDGCMLQYRTSLQKVLSRGDLILRPTHGPEIINPKPLLRAYIKHRNQRDQQIIQCLRTGSASVSSIVSTIYTDYNFLLQKAAARSILAHLAAMVNLGTVHCSDELPKLDSKYWLTS